MKVTIDGTVYDYDGSKAPMSEALWVEQVYERRYAEWQDDMAAGSARAFCMLACVIWRRNGRDVPLADVTGGKIDFDLIEMLASIGESAQAEQKAAAEAAEADPPAAGAS